MWDGPGPGPRRRGGPHFRDPHEDYGGRDRPMPDYRGRGGMNMGLMGPRHFDMPPMDMRRMDGPPMRGYDMDPRDMGGPGGRDFFRRGEEPEFAPGRQVEINFKERFVYTPGFGEHGKIPDDLDGRNMPPREPGGRFMDMDREGFPFDRPPFHNEGRRGFPMDRMDRNERFREGRDRSPMGMRHREDFDMDMPPPERRRMDMDRRGGSPFKPRGGFDSDMDFRNRPGPMSDFRGRGQSPPRFGNDPTPHVDRRGPELDPEDSGPKTKDEGDHGGDSPLTDYRCGEEMTLAEEWKNCKKDKKPFDMISKGFVGTNEPKYPRDFGRDENIRDPLHLQERDMMSMDYPTKDLNFPLNNFPLMDLPGQKGPPDFMPPLNDPLGRERETKPWLEGRDLEYRRPPPNLVKTQPPHEIQEPPSSLEDVPHNQAPPRTKLDEDPDLSNSSGPPRDQDYRDIDYRTASRAFDFKTEVLPTPDKLINESKTAAPERFIESASQDQDYRGAVFEDPVSNTVSITGIPKTATMEQILGAFTSDGVPLQRMKFKTVVQGYSYDTAIVEFLNLEDAVHIMESNKGSLKIGSSSASLKFVRPEDCSRGAQESDHSFPHESQSHFPRLGAPPEEQKSSLNGSAPGLASEGSSSEQWQRSSDLTPEAWQRQVDQQLQQQEEPPREPWSSQQPPPQHPPQPDYGESKTLIIKYVKPTTTVETILKALDPYAYLDERNVRIVKAKTGNKCFCFVDMESHEQVKRLVELLSKLRPVYIDGFRVYVEIAKPLKNPAQPSTTWVSLFFSSLMTQQPPFMPPPQYMPPMPPPVTAPTEMQGKAPLTLSRLFYVGLLTFLQFFAVPEAPDVSNYLYDATSGFYYDPETTLYYDPNSRYFYNAETQEYLYWDPALKAYIPVPGGQTAEGLTVGDQAILSNPAADAPLEMKKPPPNPHITHVPHPTPAPAPPAPALPPNDTKEEEEAKKDGKDEKPKSRAAVKIMKDMERWAKIQNRQKDSIRTPSPHVRGEDDRRQSKSADAGFAVFERKITGGSEELFKMPFAPAKKDEKSKRSMGSLGALVSDYGAGSDEEVEDDKDESKSSKNAQPSEKEDRLTDWKKMACLLCRRQFPNKDALVRHQQLSDLHKQNMEIHLKIKRSKRELEALENQEKQLNAQTATKSPEQRKRKPPPQHQDDWASSSRDAKSQLSERPGLGAEPAPAQKKKKKQRVFTHAEYKQAVRNAMFARYKELD
ncbi:hypothetical protein NQD34_003774 [Periophthalmus magnuspinnatus]|nr:hypothetical protein NQD34_003774 [Periophthalmus magnuspinnatus]